MMAFHHHGDFKNVEMGCNFYGDSKILKWALNLGDS